MNNCFAHSAQAATARVYVGERFNHRTQVNWLYVCHNCERNHRRWGHVVEPV